MKFICLITILVFSFSSFPAGAQKLKTTPSYVKDIVLYEVAPKGFTSPNGPESGTFKSTADKMPYFKKLGINTIWLTGHNWADSNHFYGIWTQYAVISPDSIEPSLGTPRDFKDLIDAAHQNGIKVFLDVITHGVMSNSPLITQHPTWFKGGSWGMIDYDWAGLHPDLDDWWVQTWTDYVLRYGVDGFRLDVSIYRPDLWKRIKQRCAQAGKPIVVLDENVEPFTEGALDFYQHHSLFMDGKDPDIDSTVLFVKNVAQYFTMDTSKQSFYYSIQLSCHDNGWTKFPAGVNPYVAEGSRCLMGYSTLFTPAIPVMMSGEEWNADFKPLPRLSPDLFSKTPPGDSSRWLYGSWLQWDQLQKASKKAMWDDVQKMLSIRTAEKEIIHALTPSTKDKNIISVEGDYNKDTPIPYLMWNRNKALVIAGNPATDHDIEFLVNLPLDKTGLKQSRFKISDLWNGGKPVVLSRKELQQFKIRVRRDKQPKGGVVVYKIEGI